MEVTPLPAGVATALDDLKRALDEIYGRRLRGVYLYGSYARNQANEHSDVDVMIVLDGCVKAGLEISRINAVVSRICLDNDVLISTLPVSASSLESERSPFLMRVLEEAVPL